MNKFTYWSPTKVIFGADTAKLTGGEVKAFGGSRVLVLYGSGSAVKSGVLGAVTQSLSDAGLLSYCVGGIRPNPLVADAQRIVDEYKDKEIDFVIGVGGGSVIDTAKAAAHGLASPETPIWAFYSGKEPVKASLPVGAVPTIAAAGSETSDSSVLTNTETGIKRGLSTSFNRPRFAIMDPVLTYTLPHRQTVCGVADILMHTLERYFTPDSDNTLTDGIAEALMRVVIQSGKEVLDKPDDYKARSELMWAGSLSHNGLTGLGQTQDFSAHQLGHALSARYDLPHAESLTAVWPAWAYYVYMDDVPRFAQYARKVWDLIEENDESAALSGIIATTEYFRFLGMPVTITEAAGLKDKAEIEILTDLCSYFGARTIGSFKVLDTDDIRDIYAAAM